MKVRGLPELQRKLNRLRTELPKETKNEIAASGLLILADAQQNVAVDTGKLRQSGSSEATNNGFGVKVAFSESYAPFIEFGTGGSVDIPDGWGALAALFRGKGLKQVNLPARPFLIPAFRKEQKELIKRLDTHLARLT